MNHKRHILILSATTILITIIVFMFSSQDGSMSYAISGSVLEWVNSFGIPMREYTLRKIAHVIMYFVMGASGTALAICVIKIPGIARYLCGMIVGSGFAFVCAYVDEWNQSHVMGRGGYISDIRFDAMGFVTGSIVTAVIVGCWIQRRVKMEGS